MKQSSNKKASGKTSAVGGTFAAIRSQISYFLKNKAAITVGGKYSSGVTVSEVVKYCIYAVMCVFFILLQVSFFSRLRPFGSVPDILIVTVAMIGMFENERAGAIFGVAVGFVSEALATTGITLLPLIYMCVGYFAGIIAADYYKKSVLLFLICDAGVVAVRAFTTLIYVVLTWDIVDISVVIPRVLIPELFSTLVMSPLPAMLLCIVWRIFRGEEVKKPGLD